MAKKGVKKVVKKKTIPAKIKKDLASKLIADNFVEFQKTMLNFSEKFTKLSNQLSKLLDMF